MPFMDSQNRGRKTSESGFWDTRSRIWPFWSFLSPSIEHFLVRTDWGFNASVDVTILGNTALW